MGDGPHAPPSPACRTPERRDSTASGGPGERLYRVAGREIGVRATSQAFLEWLDSALGPLRSGDGSAGLRYSVVVGAETDAMLKRYHVLYRHHTTL